MEPERKIEKLLRTFAKKRRVDAGDPLTLHPATRRLLQGEVARRKAKSGMTEPSVSLWELFRQRWAFVSGFALIIFISAAWWLPAMFPPKKNLPAIAEMSAAGTVASGNAVPAPPVVSLSKSEADRSDVNLADSGAVIMSTGALAANAPAAAPATVDRLAVSAGVIEKDFKVKKSAVQLESWAMQNYQNDKSSAQNTFKNSATTAKVAAVLENFQVQQSGNAIRVVDADGSVYDGSLQPEGLVVQNENMPESAPASSLDAPKEVERQKIATARKETQLAQNYSFRVTGTNLTLKQNVVFTGNLLANSGAVLKQQQSLKAGYGGAQIQSALTNQLPWSDSRIAGTAVVADTNNIEINAVPEQP